MLTTFNFHGIIIDTGANWTSIMCFQQYREYCFEFKTKMRIDKSDSKNINGLFTGASSMGTAVIPIPFLGLGLILDIRFRIMENNCESLFCLHDLKDNCLNLDVQREKILFNGKEQDLILRNDFLIYEWSPEDMHVVLYTEQELRQLHRNFGHPTISALKKMLKRANPEHQDKKTKDTINEIVNNCKTCQKFASKPRRFKLTMGSDSLKFNHIIAVDLMYLNGKPVLHVVDEATHYMAAVFLRKVSSEETWKALLRCWIRVYLGPPDHIPVDQGSNFVSRHFKGSASAEGMSIIEAPVKSPSTMTHVESYHAPLRSAYLKIKDSMSRTTTDADCLQMAVKCTNDTVVPEGLCPTLLVYGSIPRPPRQLPADTQLERAKAMDAAIDSVQKELTKRKIAFALTNTGIPKGTEQEQRLTKLPAGDPELVYRDKSNLWEGPFPFISIDGTTVVVQLPHGRQLFMSTAVKLANPPTLEEAFTQAPATATQQHASNNFHPNESSVDYTNKAEAAAPFNKNATAQNVDKFKESRERELQRLSDMGVFEIVSRHSVPPHTRIYGTRWVDSFKTTQDGSKVSKSRLVAQNYRDKGAISILTKTPTISRLGQRIAVATAAMTSKNKMYLRDISQAYCQSTSTIERNVYMHPPQEMNLTANLLLRASRTLYGIPESGLYWFLTYQKHHINSLKMNETSVAKCILYKSDGQIIQGLTALQVDDSLGHGNKNFLDLEEAQAQRFQTSNTKPRILLSAERSITFNGCEIIMTKTGQYHMEQKKKIKDLSEAPSDEDLITIPAKIQYIASCTRPDMCSPSQLLASKVLNPTPSVYKDVSRLVNWLKTTCDHGLKYTELDMTTLRLMLFTDA